MLKKAIILCIIPVILLLSSCIEPPEDTKETHVVELIKTHLTTLNELKDDKDKLLEYFKNLFDNFKMLIAFTRDTAILINGQDTVPSPDDFMYSQNTNRFIISKPLYVSTEKGKTVYSLDNITWYTTNNDPKKEIHSLGGDYYYDPVIEDNSITINYTMTFKVGDIPETITFKKPKPVINLKKGMIFSSEDEEKITVDLEEVVLYIPTGTEISGTIDVKGNLIKSETTEEGVICIRALRNLYIYAKSMMISLSFDKENWNVSPLSFEVDPKFEIKAIKDNHIYFTISGNATYDKETKSFSIVKLLLNTI